MSADEKPPCLAQLSGATAAPAPRRAGGSAPIEGPISLPSALRPVSQGSISAAPLPQ